MPPSEFRADKGRPLTGQYYSLSLQQGDDIYIKEEHLDDIHPHPHLHQYGCKCPFATPVLVSTQ